METEFNSLIKDFSKELQKENSLLANGKYSFSILGSPLKKTNVLIVGNNWGGSSISNQQKMPTINDLLLYPESTTYSGTIKFFNRVLDSDPVRLIQLLNHSVYTNACFIRTPNQEGENKEIVNLGFDISQKYLMRIIDLTAAKTIICLGNGTHSATTSIMNLMGINGEWWRDSNVHPHTIEGKCSFYSTEIDQRSIHSFPHASRFDSMWKKYLMTDNHVFSDLKKKFRSLEFKG